MNSIEKLIYEHKPIGIYDLENENSLIMAELEAYAAQLQFIEDSAEQLIKEMFFSTASGAGAERFRSLYGCNYGGENAKNYIAALMEHKEPFWNSRLWHFERMIEDFRLTEYMAARKVQVPAFSSFDLQKQKNIIALLRKYVPAHMALDLIAQERTWNELDALNRSFSESESLGLTFSELKM